MPSCRHRDGVNLFCSPIWPSALSKITSLFSNVSLRKESSAPQSWFGWSCATHDWRKWRGLWKTESSPMMLILTARMHLCKPTQTICDQKMTNWPVVCWMRTTNYLVLGQGYHTGPSKAEAHQSSQPASCLLRNISCLDDGDNFKDADLYKTIWTNTR